MANKPNHLKNEQPDPGHDQPQIGAFLKNLEAAAFSPLVDDEKYRDERGDLPQFDPDIEGQDF